MSEWNQIFAHTHRMWAEVSSSALHLLQKVLLVSPLKWRCLLRVLRPVRRPIAILDCALLKDRNLVFLVRLGPEISFRVCLWVLLGPWHFAKCWFSTKCFILLFVFCVETPKDGPGPTDFWTEPSPASLSAIWKVGVGGWLESVGICTFGMIGSWWQLIRGAANGDGFVSEEGMHVCENGPADWKNRY